MRGMASGGTAGDKAIRELLRNQTDIITRSQVLASGMTVAALRHRLRPGGPWMTVLPGIYVAGNGGLAAVQREMAAMLYGGRTCVVTGPAALRQQGVRVAYSDVVDNLIPESTKRRSIDYVHVHRTKKMPARFWNVGGIRYALAARAVADAVWGGTDMRSVSALVADAVQRGTCTVQQLADELRAGPKQGSAALRVALAEVADGVRSVAEGDLRKLIMRSGLPEPIYNPRLFVGEAFLAQPDAWWPDAGVACEVDSREWHLSPEGWERTQARHARMSALGILVLHYAPRRIRSDSAAVASELRATLAAGCQRPPLPIRAIPVR